jgi:tetratricopeptide (TPR) repeat protein
MHTSKDACMLRFLRTPLGVAWLSSILSAGVLAAPPADDAAVNHSLAVQQALAQGGYYLNTANPAKAVEVLEEQLPYINGNSTYLAKLQMAYRAHVKELWLANNEKQARRYLERLCVLDPSAANDPILCGRSPAEKTAVQPTEPKSATGVPAVAAPQVIIAPRPTTAAVAPTELAPAPASTSEPGAIFRGKLEDPFLLANQRFGSDERSLARQLLSKGETEYGLRHFEEARKFFERAYQADPQIIGSKTKEYWAYCILYHVNVRVNGAGMTTERLEEMRRLVDAAVLMSSVVSEDSLKVIRAIDARGGKMSASEADVVEVQHKPRNAQGWQMAETAHFRVLHRNESREFVEKVARTAEKTRGDMFRKWFKHDGIRWDEKCELRLHATADDYSKATGAPLDSPGHASITWAEDKSGVVSRRIDMHCDQNALLETLLPRETTHVVLAGMFGASPLPRWADVGMAVLTESSSRVGEHRRNLASCYKDGSLFGVRDLLQMADYPEKQRIRAFYAQSVALVEFLTSRHGPAVFAEFVRDGGREGFELALRRHYQWNLSDLETHWAQHVLSESARLARAQ